MSSLTEIREIRTYKRMQMTLVGITGGVVGGLFFGILMMLQGMLPAVAQLVRSESIIVGSIVHMTISMVFGAAFGLLLDQRRVTIARTIFLGLAYGVFWWVLGALTLMPLLLGATPQLNAALSAPALWSLVGHLIYGLLTAMTVAFMIGSRRLDFWG
jgi:uncharacterized membrane protein YagU involved in acid resistance